MTESPARLTAPSYPDQYLPSQTAPLPSQDKTEESFGIVNSSTKFTPFHIKTEEYFGNIRS
ncbi:MAG: hypothetical protein SOW59_04710 [Corynebacterium sp.]|nr:hypothetical protein [Corynebacterium sp.]